MGVEIHEEAFDAFTNDALDGMDKVGTDIARDYARRVGVDTGLLRSTISYDRAEGSMEGSVSAGTDYAVPHEYGHRVVVDGKTEGYARANPALRSAIAKHTQVVSD